MDHLLTVVDNRSSKLDDILVDALDGATAAKFAVAFASREGVATVLPGLQAIADSGHHAEMLVGLDMQGSHPEALAAMLQAAVDSPNFGAYVYLPKGSRAGGIYHPKLYMAERGEHGVAVVGSSNLTPGGLRANVEVNLVAVLALGGDVWSSLQETYGALKLPNARELTEAVASAYAIDWAAAHKASVRPRPSSRLLEALDAAKQVSATRSDLSGWQAQVWDALPEGVFSNDEVYAHEDVFQAAYPENQHVRPKVRQILQQLRDMDMLEPVARARWRKRRPL
jgi:HKD family nuclease